MALREAVQQVRSHVGLPSPPSLYIGSTNVDHWLPGFREQNDFPIRHLEPLVSIWIGNQSRVSAHYDFPSNIACVVAGHRRVILFPPDQLPNLYVGPLDFTPAGQPISLVDFCAPDYERFPKFREAVKTAQMSSGFREMAKEHLPTAKEAVVEAEIKAAKSVAETGFKLMDVVQQEDPRWKWIGKQGGQAHVDRCLSFAVWFCQNLVDSTGDMLHPVTGNLALGSKPQLFGTELGTFLAHWTENNVLTLAIDVDCFWQEPLGAEALSILVHEAGHARAMHHGKGFVDEIERLAGVAASVMLEQRDEIVRRWPGKSPADPIW